MPAYKPVTKPVLLIDAQLLPDTVHAPVDPAGAALELNCKVEFWHTELTLPGVLMTAGVATGATFNSKLAVDVQPDESKL